MDRMLQSCASPHYAGTHRDRDGLIDGNTLWMSLSISNKHVPVKQAMGHLAVTLCTSTAQLAQIIATRLANMSLRLALQRKARLKLLELFWTTCCFHGKVLRTYRVTLYTRPPVCFHAPGFSEHPTRSRPILSLLPRTDTEASRLKCMLRAEVRPKLFRRRPRNGSWWLGRG